MIHGFRHKVSVQTISETGEMAGFGRYRSEFSNSCHPRGSGTNPCHPRANPCHPRASLTFRQFPSKQNTCSLHNPQHPDSPQLFPKINEISPVRKPLSIGGTKTTLARKNRFAPPGYWLHLTQRGNYRQTVFSCDADRQHFLSLLETHSEERGVRIAAYTLMSNHFHLVAAGDRPDAISLFMMNVNGQYSAYRHASLKRRGHLWQGRFFSCVLDDAHWATALSYVEMNSVRARLAPTAADYRWSSARAHLGLDPAPDWLDLPQFHRHWPTPAHWQQSLATLTRREAAALRCATRADTALGSEEFLSQLEQRYAIQLRPKPLGRPRKPPSADALIRNHALSAGTLT